MGEIPKPSPPKRPGQVTGQTGQAYEGSPVPHGWSKVKSEPYYRFCWSPYGHSTAAVTCRCHDEEREVR